MLEILLIRKLVKMVILFVFSSGIYNIINIHFIVMGCNLQKPRPKDLKLYDPKL